MMIRLKYGLLAAAGLVAIAPLALTALEAGAPAVHALFDLDHPETGPFPTDFFTVTHLAHATGRRVNLPYPDCAVRPSDCDDLSVINTLDGFNLQTRLSIPFDGAIDPSTVTSESVFLISLGSTRAPWNHGAGTVVGINQVVWDTLTNTLHAESDELLAQHTRYALIVTNGVRDARGQPVEASKAFRRFWSIARPDYALALVAAVHAAKQVGVREHDIVAASVYTTQSITPVMERIRDRIKADVPAPANFRIGPQGERAVFGRTDVAGIAWRQHTAVSPPGFTTMNLDLAVLNVVPGAVSAIAYGTYVSPEYRVPGEYIPRWERAARFRQCRATKRSPSRSSCPQAPGRRQDGRLPSSVSLPFGTSRWRPWRRSSRPAALPPLASIPPDAHSDRFQP